MMGASSGTGGGKDAGNVGGGDESDKRLPSFRFTRDLSLVGKMAPNNLGRSRKNFVPNIPPKRDRGGTDVSSQLKTSKNVAHSTTSPTEKPFSNRINRGRGRLIQQDGHDKRQQKPELIQSSSIFAAGVGDGEKVKRFIPKPSSRFGGSSEKGTKANSSAGVVSTIDRLFNPGAGSAVLQGNKSLKEVYSRVHERIGDGRFISDLTDDDLDKFLSPIALPMSQYLKDSINEMDLSIELPLKAEDVDVDSNVEPQAVPTLSKTLDPLSFAHTVMSAPPEGTIVFLQMPDQLPILDKTSTEASGQVNVAKLSNDIGLLPEGYVGKIQILESGASRLVLGENIFEIQAAKPVCFRQELTAIDLENKKMTNLGPVKQKFICTPDLELLFQQSL